MISQDEVNDREQANPANWSKGFAFYHSKADSRLWVPKQQAWMGRSLNMAKPLAKLIVLTFILVLVLLAVLVVWTVLPHD